MTYLIIHPGTGTILDADECQVVCDDGDDSESRLVAAARNHGTPVLVRGIRIKLDGGLVRSVDAYDRHGVPCLPVEVDIWDYDVEGAEDNYDIKADENGDDYIEYRA
jgi:hypothetical protein